MLSRALLALALATTACGRINYDRNPNDLVVDVTEDRMSGPADIDSAHDLPDGRLSLREALTIANNRPGQQRITFDDDVFPPGEGGVITLTEPLPDLVDDETHVYGNGGVILDASGLSTPVFVVLGDYVWIKHLTIRDAGADAIEVRGATGAYLYDLTILDPAGRAVVATDCVEMTLAESRLERPGGNVVVATRCSEVTIRNDFVIVGDKENARGVRFEQVEGSFVLDNLIDPGEARLVDLLDSSRNEIVGNILDRGHAGVVLEGESHENLVFRNVIIGSVYDGVYVASESTGNVVVHNTMYECATPLVDGAADTLTGNNLTDPVDGEFADPASYDFRLRADSPHVDGGDDMGFDVWPDGPDNFLGAAPDVGAVESH